MVGCLPSVAEDVPENVLPLSSEYERPLGCMENRTVRHVPLKIVYLTLVESVDDESPAFNDDWNPSRR